MLQDIKALTERNLVALCLLLSISFSANAGASVPSPAEWNVKYLVDLYESPASSEAEKFWAKAFIQGTMMAALTTRISLDSGFEAGGRKERSLYDNHPCTSLSKRLAKENVAALKAWMMEKPARRSKQNPALAAAMEIRDTCEKLKAGQ